MILRARIVLPVSQPAIEDGAVVLSGRRIVSVLPWKNLPARRQAGSLDLGDAILLPGLVNAHCHLDYTDMSGLIPPQRSFTDWIKLITTAKSEWNFSEYAASWLRGADMLLRSGTTTVGDFEAVPELLPDVWTATPLRVISFLELTGVKSRRNPRAILQEALRRIRSLPSRRSRAVLAPHAPYSTQPELIRIAATTARRRKWPVATHVAESIQEFDMFMNAKGDLFDWLRRNERDMDDCGARSPIQLLRASGLLAENLLVIHANYLRDGDARLLAKSKTSVVHCPRSHFYFRHRKFPFRELTRARVNICLGTDSLATVYKRRHESVELNMFDEMRAFARAHSRLPAEKILRLATVNGARALGLAGTLGQLSPGALADLIAIPFNGKAPDACAAVLNHRGDVTASLINGKWIIPAQP
jgi:cytosine/adenosine deaminase-related metal-dependent hydrolase